ncbi:MAG: hypothetical protein RMI79_07380, partial [Nitrososphaerota archaeon]|nr:hypothetical protein [Nitrososphaerota archaeon]
DFKCYLDEEDLLVSVDDTVIMPDEEVLIKAYPVLASIFHDKLDSKHSIEVNIAGSKLTYDIPPLCPRIEIINLGYKPLFGNTVSLEKLNIKIENRWSFPLNVKWVEITINMDKTSYSLDREFEVKPNEIVEVTYDLLFLTANKGDVVTVRVKLGATEVVKSITIS